MRQVAILGIGQIKVDEHWDLSLRELGGNAAFAAMQDAGMDKVDSLFVGNMLSPMVSGQNQLGTFFSDWVGLWDQESVKVEAACASGEEILAAAASARPTAGSAATLPRSRTLGHDASFRKAAALHPVSKSRRGGRLARPRASLEGVIRGSRAQVFAPQAFSSCTAAFFEEAPMRRTVDDPATTAR